MTSEHRYSDVLELCVKFDKREEIEKTGEKERRNSRQVLFLRVEGSEFRELNSGLSDSTETFTASDHGRLTGIWPNEVGIRQDSL